MFLLCVGLAVPAAAQSGTIKPKYIVVSVMYAPPGKSSSVDYGSSTKLGASTQFDHSFVQGTTISASVQFGNINSNTGPSVTASGTQTFTQTQANSSSIAINKTTTSDIVVQGPVDSAQGINHDYDVILLWINPVINLIVTGTNSAQWTGYSFDSNDPANEVDIVPVYVAWLKDPTTMPPGVADALQRTWAADSVDGSGRGLTQNDFNNILARDPFANGSANIDPARFQLTGQTFSYTPPPNGGQAITQKFALKYEQISTESLQAKDDYKTTYSIDVSASILGFLSAHFKDTHTFEVIDTVTQTTTDTLGQTASLSLKSPDPGYTGPTDLQVYRDNIYGTFMFVFVPSVPPDFFLAVSPISQNIAFGGSARYTVSGSALNSFTGSIDLSVSGLPLGCDSAAFNPLSITPPGSSTLTVSNCSIPGDYVSFVVGTSGTLPQASTAFSLSVGPQPAQTGTGCNVGFSFNPLPPVEGQPFTITGTLQGLAPNNTGLAPIALDNQQFCVATNSSPCAPPPSSLPAGTHVLGWTCTSTGSGGNGTGSGSLEFTVESSAPSAPTWSINPKFVVLSVIYAPPGKTSTVDYSSSTLLGTKTSLDKLLQQNTTVSLSLGAGVTIIPKIKGGIKLGVTVTGEKSFTQSGDDNSSVEINKTTSNGIQVAGPASDVDGIDHDYDVILVWLNPTINLTITGDQSVQWSGYSFDARDPAVEVDVVPLYVAWLKDPTTMPPGVADALARRWADSTVDGLGPGLNSIDFAQILALDPFSNPAYAPALIPGKTTTTDSRYDLVVGNTLAYEPPPDGGQPLTQKSSLVYEQTQVDGLTATAQLDVGYSLDVKADLTIPVAAWLNVNLSTEAKASNKLTLRGKVSETTTQTDTQTAALSLTGPRSTYTGPTELQVFKDNLYGTFMFSFPPGTQGPDFFLFASTGSQTVGLGGSTTFQVEALNFNGFNGNINLTVSGMPANVSAGFSPPSISGTASSTLTVSATPLALPGIYTLTITGTGPGGLSDSMTVQVIVSAADFSIVGSPASHTIIPGQSASYTVSTEASAGFNGIVSLSATSLPAGVTASFAPLSISGTGSSTVTINVPPTTLPGTYTLPITGSSGSLTRTTNITLIVSAPPFVLSASPASQPVIAGQSTTFRILSTPLAGFIGTATLNISGLPTGVTATFDPPAITGLGVANLTVNTSLTTPPGGYSLTITGTVGSLPQASMVVSLLVTEPSTQTGKGCNVDLTLNPRTPLPGEPATLTGVLQGLDSTGIGPIALDNQQLCVATNAQPCVRPVTLTVGIHSVRWSCRNSSGTDTGSGNQLFAVGSEGSINPKYVVLSVIYAPPGSKSTVDYNSSTLMGTKTSLSDAFSLKTSLASTLNFGQKTIVPSTKDDIGHTVGFSVDLGLTVDFTQTLEGTDSISLTKSESSDIVVPGPKDSGSGVSVGINHDYDVVLLWLNPVVNLVVTGTQSALWTGYRFDPDDPVNEMDVVPVYVAWLKDPSLMPPGVAFALARTWAPEPLDGSGTGLTSDDYATILQRDPFASGSQAIDPARFVLTGETFSFAPPPNGSQPFTQNLSLAYQTTTQQTHTVTDTYQVAYSVKDSHSESTTVKDFTDNNLLKDTKTNSSSSSSTRGRTFTFTHGSSLEGTQTFGQSAKLSLVGPAAYAGPTDLQVYQDNIYGTFMFAFVPETTFQIAVADDTQTVSEGGNAIFAVSATILTGVSETIVFSTSGLPSTATWAFNPASRNTSGASSLMVNTSSTPPGIYPFTIIGTVTAPGVIETHVVNALLIVGPANGFLFTVTPPVQTTPAGQTVTYTVTTSAIAGFTGTVTLGTGPLPPGVQASFNPASITGSGSSTLSITTSGTPVGSYSLNITGTTSGLPQARTMVGLFVYAPFATTGAGCSVGFTFNPSPLIAGQTFTITGTLQGLAPGNTGVAGIALDHQQLCAATETAPCAPPPINPLTEGTHEFEWHCTNNAPNGANVGTGDGIQLFTVGPADLDGSILPKYVILSVIYTPPGKGSTVDYGSSTVLGTSAKITDSFKVEGSASVAIGHGQGVTVKIGPEPPPNGKFDPSFTNDVQNSTTTTGSAAFTQATDDASSIAIKKTNAFDIQVPGLANPTDGIDHNYDIILLWINPAVNFVVTGSGVAQIPSIAFEPSDPAKEVDVVPVYVAWLRHPETMPDGVKNALARTWAPPLRDGSSPGLTTDDFADILKADPFTDPNYVLTVPPGAGTTADSRFDLQVGTSLPYVPPPTLGQPITEKFSLQYQTVSAQGHTAINEHTVGFSAEGKAKFDQFLLDSLKATTSWTWTHKVETQNSNTTGQTASLSLTGPCFGYVGPTNVQVFRDNIYGTFMFSFAGNGLQTPDFSLCMDPNPLPINTGSSDSYTISTSPINDFTGAIALSVSGLPADVTATFDHTSITGTGTAKLTVNVAPTAAAGTFTITVTGTTSGGLTHFTNALLIVKAVPVFALSATPATQPVVVGGTTTYTVSSTALNGLTGDVHLTVTGLPTGATSSFSPTTITGSTGTSTLTVDTSGVTTAADSTFAIKGTNGSVTQSVPVTLKVVDFTINAAPATQQVVIGASTAYTVTVTAINGFNDTITPTVAGLPAGTTVTFNPATITGAGTTTMTITTSGSTPAANSTLTISASSGTAVRTATVTLNVVDFTFAVTPSTRTILGGGTTTYTVTTTAVNGFSGTVIPTVTGLPAGVTATFSPANITGGSTSTMTVTAASSAPGGNSTLNLTGTIGTISKSANVALVLQNFTITATPATQTVTAGNNTSYTVTYAAANGFTGTTTPSVTGLPTGTTASFNPATIPGGSGTTTLTVATTPTTPGTNATLTITGTSGTAVNSASVSLTVRNAFTITATPATQTVTAGGSTSYTVTVAPLNGFTGTVTPSVSGLPAGATASFNPATIPNASGTSTMTVNTTADTLGANSALTVTGTSGVDVKTTPVTLAVQNFTCTVTPGTQAIVIGGNATYTVTCTAQNGLIGNLNLGVTGVPAGATTTFSPTTITGSTGTSTLTVTTSGTTLAANSTLTITATNGTLSHALQVGLSVTDFNIAVSPATQTTVAGGSTTYTVTTTAVNGFTGTVTPTVTGLPAGTTASFSPGTISGAGTSTMTVTTSSSTPAANSTLTVAGTSGPRAKTAPGVTLSVTDFTISISPATQTVTAGGGTSYTVTATALNGFTGNVPLSIAGLPSGTTSSFTPATIAGAGTSTLTVNTTGATPGGTSTLTVTGNSGGTPAHSTSATLVVVPPLVTLRPTVDTPVNGLPYANPANAQDGDAGTFASGVPAGTQSRGGEIWSGFGAGPGSRTVVNLKITSAGNCVFGQAEGFALDYSVNGGATWTTIYSMGIYGGACTSRAQQTDVVSLSAGQNLTQVQVRTRFTSFGNTSHQVYDAWIEAQ
jgi:hypothetical protein